MLDAFDHNQPRTKLSEETIVMRAFFAVAVLVSICATSWAAESCAVRAAQLLSDGENSALSTWFTAPSADMAAKLKEASEYVGSLENITPAVTQSAGRITRKSIYSNNLPTSYTFDGSWADAVSTKIGPVKIQASTEAGSSCRLLALHIDMQKK